MAHYINAFLMYEDGAVTVDWVVLTAALVAMILLVFVAINDALFSDAGLYISSRIDEAAALNR